MLFGQFWGKGAGIPLVRLPAVESLRKRNQLPLIVIGRFEPLDIVSGVLISEFALRVIAPFKDAVPVGIQIPRFHRFGNDAVPSVFRKFPAAMLLRVFADGGNPVALSQPGILH